MATIYRPMDTTAYSSWPATGSEDPRKLTNARGHDDVAVHGYKEAGRSELELRGLQWAGPENSMSCHDSQSSPLPVISMAVRRDTSRDPFLLTDDIQLPDKGISPQHSMRTRSRLVLAMPLSGIHARWGPSRSCRAYRVCLASLDTQLWKPPSIMPHERLPGRPRRRHRGALSKLAFRRSIQHLQYHVYRKSRTADQVPVAGATTMHTRLTSNSALKDLISVSLPCPNVQGSAVRYIHRAYSMVDNAVSVSAA